MFSLFLPGKHIGCFPGRQNLNMFANFFILGKQTSFPAVGGGKGKNEPQQEVVVHPCDALPGPPISWIPPLFSPTLRVFVLRARRRQAHIPKNGGGALGGLQLCGWERAGAATSW